MEGSSAGVPQPALTPERQRLNPDIQTPNASASSSGSGSSPASPAKEVLAGLIERVTFHSAANGFCVLRIKARGHRELVTVVGHAAEISPGEWITVSGEWVNDREHGLQFRATFLRTSPPTTAEGMARYLGSGMIRGIGPIYASKLIAAFGEEVFSVIEQAPARLRDVPGIGPVRAERIARAWADQKVVREIMVFLHSHGVGTARAVRIFKTYGNDAVQVMADNPYRLARDIRGIGFRTADAIASRLGIAPEALIRLRAGLNHALLEASGEGHCGLPTDELLRLASELLAVPDAEGTRHPLDLALIQAALALELAEGSVVADTLPAMGSEPGETSQGTGSPGEASPEGGSPDGATPEGASPDAATPDGGSPEGAFPEGASVKEARPAVFLAHLHRDERRIAVALRALSAGLPPWHRGARGALDPRRALAWVEGQLGLELAPSQRRAVELALAHKVLVITGGPGVGKTTLINAILRILSARQLRLQLCAPTGRAARRMTEATGLEAKTIHRLLEFDPSAHGFRRGPELPLECDLLVVDETSMVDVPLMASLLAALPDEAALLLVGDVDQLPSVGPGQVLADAIASGAVPVARLSEVFRQAAASRIITTAHAINHGVFPDLRPPAANAPCDFFFAAADTPERAAALILRLVAERIPARFGLDPIQQVQVLTPMARGDCGSRALNAALQQRLNPDPAEQVERFGSRFAPGDKVMQIANDYEKEVFNGDLGTIDSLDADSNELTVIFEGRAVVYGWGELDHLVPAYACTIHKSQGSEYPAVVIPLLTQHYTMLRRNLVYTGLTRGKRLVVLVGQRKALALAVRNHRDRGRWTKLAEWLKSDLAPAPLA